MTRTKQTKPYDYVEATARVWLSPLNKRLSEEAAKRVLRRLVRQAVMEENGGMGSTRWTKQRSDAIARKLVP